MSQYTHHVKKCVYCDSFWCVRHTLTWVQVVKIFLKMFSDYVIEAEMMCGKNINTQLFTTQKQIKHPIYEFKCLTTLLIYVQYR